MRTALLNIFCLLSFVVPAHAAEPVTITYAAPRVGDKTVRSIQNEMSVKLQVSGGERAFATAYGLQELTEMAVTVIDAGRKAATKIKVDYIKDDHAASGPEGVESTSQAIEGKSYVVANTRTGMEVYLPGEKQYAPIEEAGVVLMDFQELGRMPRMSALFANKTFKPGERIAVPDKAVQGLFADAGTLTDLSVVLRGLRREDDQEIALFDVQVDFERREGYLVYKAPLKGEIAVDVKSALPVRLSVSGEMKIAGTKPPDGLIPEKSAEGKGSIKYVLTQQLTPAAK